MATRTIEHSVAQRATGEGEMEVMCAGRRER